MRNDEYQYFFHQGTLEDAYEYMGCQYDVATKRAIFRVWAPHAKSVTVVGDFNGWNKSANFMWKITDGGIYEGIIEGVELYQTYKYCIEDWDNNVFEKADPYGFFAETRGATASKVMSLNNFFWSDSKWMKARTVTEPYDKPINIYECHIASWRKYEDGNFYDYRKFADEVIEYMLYMNYTHLELMGIAEHPFDGSWGYQVTSYFAPTSRFGRPEDFAYLINKCHEAGIAVILDWVPGHFPKDEHGLCNFDGKACYEPTHKLRKEHIEWGTMCFDYAKPEVATFLISNAMMWFDKYHIDGLRVDAVASMLYLDYNRSEWLPNIHGGNENLDAVRFLKKLNTAVFGKYKNALMIAEESTAFSGVTKPVHLGGLGFNYKWNMGWMNDSLSYVKQEPIYRQFAHNKLTFSLEYAFSENFILPLSHDEVVHGKGSLLNKMPGDYELKFAGLRNYLMYMFGHPGKKLSFMGSEFGQWTEWDYTKSIDWVLVEFPLHKALQAFVKELNRLYKEIPAMYEIDNMWKGFEWIIPNDSSANVFAWERKDKEGNKLLFIINFAPTKWGYYRVPCTMKKYKHLLSTSYHGINTDNFVINTEEIENSGKSRSFAYDIDMMSGYIFYAEKDAK